MALAAGQGRTALADHGLVTPRQRPDKLIGLRGDRGGANVIVRGVNPAVGDIRGDRPWQKKRFLQDHRDPSPNIIQGEFAEVDPIETNGSLPGIQEPWHEGGQRGFAGAGRTDNCHHLTGTCREADRVQHRAVGDITGRHLIDLDADPGCLRRQSARVRGFRQDIICCENFLDPVEPGLGSFEAGVGSQ